MNICEICIKRPVLATVLNLILIVIGIVSFNYLSVAFLPEGQEQSIFISSYYPGASAQLVESSVTTPLEQAVSNISGIEAMSSESNVGMSSISIRLLPGFDLYEIANKIRNAVAMASSQLPSTVRPPTVQAGHGSADLLDVGFTATDRNLLELRDYVDKFILNKIQQVPGVAGAMIDGANALSMRIWLNPEKMNAMNLSIDDVISAVQNSNIQLSAGQIKGHIINYPITANTKLHTSNEFANIILKKTANHLVRIKDIAQVALGSDLQEPTYVRVNGKPGIIINIYNEASANPIKVSDAIIHLLNEKKHQLPPAIKMVVAYNQATYMKESIHEIYEAIIFSVLVVAIIIFLFLGSIRAALIPIATIPVCLISSFGLIYFFGFSINKITLLALVLSIGIIVDDAIVMLENIHRYIEAGKKPLTAALEGSRQIIFPIIVMTLTLAAVYAPIALAKGHTANIMISFAFTLAGAVIISGITALTLSPMMCARILTTQQKNSRYSLWLDQTFHVISLYYQKILIYVLAIRFKIFFAAIILAIFGYFLLTSFPKDFIPNDDKSFLITHIPTTGGVNADYTQKQVAIATRIIEQLPSIQATFSIAGGESKGFNAIFIQLKPYQQRSYHADQIAEQINRLLQKNPLLNNTHTFSPSFGGSMKHQLEFYLLGSAQYMDLYRVSQKLVADLKKYPGLINLDSDLQFNSQQYEFTVNRELAGNIDVNIRTINNAMANLVGGSAISSYDIGGKSYDVYIQAADSYLHNLNSINKFNVKSNNGQLVPLSNLIQIQPILAQNSLLHYDRLRATLISAQLAPGYSLGEAVQYLQTNLPQLLPPNIKYEFRDSAKKLIESSETTTVIFIFAFIFIYLVLSAQFESFIDPLIVLFAVPFSIVGGLVALKLLNGAIDIYTSIGLVTLIGLIAKHGILITQFANQLQAEGLTTTDALIKAATIRLRPILMTTAAMIVGALPLLCATGGSAVSRREIGAVITSGLLFGTFFSLILIPVCYSYLMQFKKWLSTLMKSLNITSTSCE